MLINKTITYGLQQHTRNLEDKLGRIGGYHYGNPKQ